MIKAVIFDMDGVLIDSEIYYIRVLKQFLKENGVSLEESELHFLAGSAREVEDEFLASCLVNLTKVDAKNAKDAYFKKHPVDYAKLAKKGQKAILEYLKSKKITLALASSSPLDNIEEVLEACAISSYFSYVVSGEMFKRTKPDPEIYEYTTKLLGFTKEEIIVVEDSTYGITAADRANLKVIAVRDPRFNFDTSKATYVINELNDIKKII